MRSAGKRVYGERGAREGACSARPPWLARARADPLRLFLFDPRHSLHHARAHPRLAPVQGLSFLSSPPSPHSHSTPITPTDTAVGPGPHDTVHALVAGAPGSPPMVLLPGYGSGSALWFRSLKFLASAFHVHAADLLGMGLSGRPRYTESTREAAEAWFVAGFDAYRAATPALRDTPFVLVGHSLGGYLAAAYAAAHPDRVAHLVLVCPAGVAAPPAGWEGGRIPAWAAKPFSLTALAFKTATAVWEAGLTPGGVVRTLGPVGPGLVKKYVRGRFRDGADLDGPEAAALERYFYALLAGRGGSGEHALSHLLAPFA